MGSRPPIVGCVREKFLDVDPLIPVVDDKQIPESLSRKDCAPIIEEPRGVTWGAYIFVVLYSGDHHHADPHTPLLGGCPPHLRYLLEAGQGGPCLPSRPSGPRRRRRATPPNGLRDAALYLFGAAQMGPSLCHRGHAGAGGSPPLRATAQNHLRDGTAPQSPRRPRPPGAGRPLLAVGSPATCHGVGPTERVAGRVREGARGSEKEY